MSITPLETTNKTNQTDQIYLDLIQETIIDLDLVNIVIVENIWTKPIVVEQVIKTLEQIKSGSIVIYLFGNKIDQFIPISNFVSLPKIIQYIQLKILDILPSQWGGLKPEQTIQTISEYKHLEFFKKKNIILI